jgi:hypothetical protein
MDAETSQGVMAELDFLLKEDWTALPEVGRIRIHPPKGSSDRKNFDQLFRSEVWRIAEFVGYANFVSITRNADMGYTVISTMTSGGGLEIVFERT